jgi:hypothetical protein
LIYDWHKLVWYVLRQNMQRTYVHFLLLRQRIKLIIFHRWASDCCLSLNKQCLSYIMVRCPLCTRPSRLVEFYIVPAHWNNSRQGPATLCSFSFLQRAQRRSNNYQFYSPGLELTIYHNRYEHANHYTIGVFCFVFIDFMYYSSK